MDRSNAKVAKDSSGNWTDFFVTYLRGWHLAAWLKLEANLE